MKVISKYGEPFKEPTMSFAELAEQIGTTEQELIQIAFADGLIDKHGRPTEKAIREGLLTT